MLVRVGGPGARVVGGGVVEPGVGVVAEGVGGGVRVLLARRLWAISLGSHRCTGFQVGGGAPPVQISPVRPFSPYWVVQP